MKHKTNWKAVAKRVGERLTNEATSLGDLEYEASIETLDHLKAHLQILRNTLDELSYELRNGHEPHI